MLVVFSGHFGALGPDRRCGCVCHRVESAEGAAGRAAGDGAALATVSQGPAAVRCLKKLISTAQVDKCSSVMYWIGPVGTFTHARLASYLSSFHTDPPLPRKAGVATTRQGMSKQKIEGNSEHMDKIGRALTPLWRVLDWQPPASARPWLALSAALRRRP